MPAHKLRTVVMLLLRVGNCGTRWTNVPEKIANMPAVPFNGIGQIIASGGVQSVAIMLAGGKSNTAISIALEGKYDGIPVSAIDTLINMAESGLAAADNINLGDPSQPIDFTGVPVIHGILGDNAAGNRFLTITEAVGTDGESSVLSYNYLPYIESLNDLWGEIIAQLIEWICEYPKFAESLGVECPDEDTASEIIGEFGKATASELSEILGVDILDSSASKLLFIAMEF